MSDLEARIAEVIAATDKSHAFRAADYSDRERPTFRCSCGLAATGKYHEHFNGELTTALAPVIREREAEALETFGHMYLNPEQDENYNKTARAGRGYYRALIQTRAKRIRSNDV